MLEYIFRAGDPTVIVAVVMMSAILVLGVAYAVAAARFGPRARLKRRIAVAVGKPVAGRPAQKGGRDASQRKKLQETLQQLEQGAKFKKARRHVLRQEIEQAGLNVTIKQFAFASVGAGVIAALVTLVLGLQLAALPTGLAVALMGPRFVLGHLRKRRLKLFTRQFADAIDVIVRGIQSGLPVGECLAIIGRESPQPIAGEFIQIVESVKLGLPLEEALKRAQDRTPSQELRFFSIVLQIQQQTGGNLAETLSNLSRVLRDRKKMRDKANAMAAEANTSAMIIGSLPFVVTGALALVNPSYIGLLFEDTIGHIAIAGGLIWMTIGVFMMRQMINFDM